MFQRLKAAMCAVLLESLRPQTTQVSYGRSIMMPRQRRGLGEDKEWFGWEVSIPSGASPELALEELRARADRVEAQLRAAYEERHRGL